VPVAPSVSLDELIAALSRPDAYRFEIGPIEVRQTHISVLFLANDRVYKVKKPVALGFLDFRDPKHRAFLCREEVRLNQALAPGVYLGVVPIVRGPDGRLLVGASDRVAVEHAVEMVRLPDDRMLDRLLDDGRVGEDDLDRIVEVLVPFHATAATGRGIDEHGEPEAVGRSIAATLDQLDAATRDSGLLSTAVVDRLRAAATGFIGEHLAVLRRRVADGRIREGHGDLHAANICMADTRPVIYDRLEFDFALRCGDVARELSFLAMDLMARGEHGLAHHLAGVYARATADETLETVMPLYTRHLACVRGLVSVLAGKPDAARRYFQLAAAMLAPRFLVLTCGPPGAGKSVLARGLSRPTGAAVIRSDVVRKTLAGLAPTDRPSGAVARKLYGTAMSERTYATMLDEARTALDVGESVIVDATFSRRKARAPFVGLAAATGARLLVVHLDCPPDVIDRRLAARRADATEASDANAEVSRRLRASFEPPSELPPTAVLTTDCADTAANVTTILERLATAP